MVEAALENMLVEVVDHLADVKRCSVDVSFDRDYLSVSLGA